MNNKAIVVHVNVALADNKNQWIVKVPKNLGNGQNPDNNLYWGAMYGVKTYLRKAGWEVVDKARFTHQKIIERIVFFRNINRTGKNISIYLVAEAWDGAYIDDTVNRFLAMASGQFTQSIQLSDRAIAAGSQAHLIVYIGHNLRLDPTVLGYNGLMKIKTQVFPIKPGNPNKNAIVLACQSHAHFSEQLQKYHVFPLLTTTGNMAPEAYTLHAAVVSWIQDSDPIKVRNAAANAYRKYQKIGIKAAQSLFTNGLQ